MIVVYRVNTGETLTGRACFCSPGKGDWTVLHFTEFIIPHALLKVMQAKLKTVLSLLTPSYGKK